MASGFDPLDRGRLRDQRGQASGLSEEEDPMARLKLRMALERRVVARKAEREAESPAKIPTGGGAALDGGLRKKMESQLGADLSSARIHTGGESASAARSLGARAFTVGNDVHFNAGEYKPGTKEGDRLIAHELTHVVQGQHAGPAVARKEEKEGGEAEAGEHKGEALEVSQPGDEAECEADDAANRAVEDIHPEGGAKSESHAKQQEKPKIAAKLDGVGRKIFRNVQTGTTTGTITNSYYVGAGPAPQVQGEFQPNRQPSVNPNAENPNFEADAIEFEKNLGGLAFSKAPDVGAALVGKVKAYIRSKVSPEDFDTLGAETTKLLQACGGIKPEFAGSVGQDPKVIQEILLSQAELAALKAQIDAAKGHADKLANLPEPPNVREQMTLVYNFTTKVLVSDIMQAAQNKTQLAELVNKGGLNAKAVQDRVAFMEQQAQKRTPEQAQKQRADGPNRQSSWDLVGMVPQDHKDANLNQGEGGATANTTQAVEGQWSARDRRTSVDPQANLQQKESQNPSSTGDGQRPAPPDRTDRSANDLKEQGAGLSGREMALQGTGDADPLKWSEGAKMWVINEKDKWVQTMRELNLPLAAGPSGTTNVLMNANAMLGATSPVQARLACIGYLLPINAHSLVEVCAAASAHGVGFNPGKQMYRSLPPLSEDELRGCGRVSQHREPGKKLFPDEADVAPQQSQAQEQGGAQSNGGGGAGGPG
jgi:hypothetical protein